MAEVSVSPTFETAAFHFSGQSSLDAWTITDLIGEFGWSAYDSWRTHEIGLCFQRIRDLADEFPTWQRRARTGRHAIDERTHLIATLLRQFLDVTYDALENFLRIFAEFFRIVELPDSKTLSEKNRTPRFRHLLKRFHRFVLDKLPKRKSIIATDATGYGNTKRAWRDAPYTLRATQPWIKSHAAVEVPQLLYVNSEQTPGRVHESQMFEPVWGDFPENITPIRSVADGAYSGEFCLTIARAYGATPIHGIRKDARHTSQPESHYELLVNFSKHWPNRFARLTGPRKLVETTFNMTKQRFGHQLRCRDPIARKNEISAKEAAHNIRVIAMRDYLRSR